MSSFLFSFLNKALQQADFGLRKFIFGTSIFSFSFSLIKREFLQVFLFTLFSGLIKEFTFKASLINVLSLYIFLLIWYSEKFSLFFLVIWCFEVDSSWKTILAKFSFWDSSLLIKDLDSSFILCLSKFYRLSDEVRDVLIEIFYVEFIKK